MTGHTGKTSPTRIITAIPVRDQLSWTQPLVESLLGMGETDEVWLFDNGSTDGTLEWAKSHAALDDRLTLVERPRAWLHAMWNEMVAIASSMPGTHLAILNNDIRVDPGFIRGLSNALGECDLVFVDREAEGAPTSASAVRPAVWKDRTGWAFMLRADAWHDQPFAVDPGLRIWWGDDDLARRAQARGLRLAIASGVGCFHAISQSEFPGDFERAIDHDRHYFARIWGDA